MPLVTKIRRALGPLRVLHYHLWRATGRTGVSRVWPELRALQQIVRRSAPEDLAGSGDGPRVLVFSFRAWNTHTIADALIGQALRQRGARVEFFTCGGRLPVCDITAHTLAPPMPCNTCAPYVTRVLATLRLPFHEMRDFLGHDERAELHRRIAALRPDEFEAFALDGLPLGQLVRASVQWFLLSGNPALDDEGIAIYRKFLISGAYLARATARLLDQVRPDKLYLLNGLFFAERIAVELARARGIPFITHEGGFMPDTRVFAHDGFASYYELDETWRACRDRPLTAEENAQLDAYLDARARGQRDVRTYYPSIESDAAAVAGRLALDRTKPIVSLFTNLDWDTAAFAGNSAFASMEAWLAHTIRWYAGRDAQLIIRVHPAEVRLRNLAPREGVVPMLRRLFETLPPNVRLIPPESNISSYTLMELSSLGLVYTSTTGMEMALRGRRVVTAGRAYYVDKGFTRDARTAAEYDRFLEDAQPMTAEEVELARRYASLFFFRHHIRFPLATTEPAAIRFNFRTLAALQPGREPELDLICDGILHGRPFLHERASA